ncbi:class I poly(R)-hydroxyalkanoic acid synthase [Kushneria phosphatilytica]|uniref:Class I poly(R)-hydroxyalkanoic acid synthase n=1 Tax=Kushneria phosphatilytica TaxID=657387 RepID=A0A1S1P1D6_9GAMM|nr:class I poly(R)-hydroxyalkanoic acid synthase [Kushneria phosphatilytica]OHV13867.1 class I poly(R)-hydroxyalkanoic acid synthase [Kushneria phosphatilytica]QEL10420.1 class I poly(R)-hydroxyalkanoic acid synthase [Kushneria phosphatilytica]
MYQIPSFSSYWSAQVPFVTTIALQQLRLWMSEVPWFRDRINSQWFDIPVSRLQQLQMDYQQEWYQLGLQSLTQTPFSFNDKRFESDNWRLPFFGSLAAFYLLNSRYMIKLIEELKIDDEKSRLRLHYLVEQTIAANAPSNYFASNPDALDQWITSGGTSLLFGMLHLASDIQEGKMRQSDPGDFVIGRDLATTPGDVVFENELFQLIQYRSLSERQYRIPLFIVPPTINKFYVLDLRPENSLIRYALEQGHPVFLISWRNFDLEEAELTWDDFIQDGVIQAIQVTRSISESPRLNCVGYCIGGTLLTCALAVLAARKDKNVANTLSLLTSFLDYSQTGSIGLFIDEELVSRYERTIGGQGGAPGIFRGEDMGNTFSLLRPNELWWNYNVDKYLKGKRPRALDFLYWNNDSTSLPGPMFCWYLRHAYLQNDFKSGDVECCGVRIELNRINVPTYLFGTHDDHIVPWRSIYTGLDLLPGDKRFVLGASGHIAGVINPPVHQKRHYWINTELPADPETWLATAEKHSGSWWEDWFSWLAEHSDELGPATHHAGSAEYPPIEAAPGRYVRK